MLKFFAKIYVKMILFIYNPKFIWGLGIGDWGLGIGPNPQSPIPNPHNIIILYNII